MINRIDMTTPTAHSHLGLTDAPERAPRPLGIFAKWRLLAYGYTFPIFYAALFLYLYRHGLWLLHKDGMLVYHDFTNMFAAGWQALHGHAASVYDPVEHLKAQQWLMGTEHALFSIWPYPPPYFLIIAPLAALPYLVAFFTFETATLLGLIAVVYHIVRRPATIALVLASPFTAWNFLMGQSGFLTATLIGGALFSLESQPVLAGVFLGCLIYKPQFGILFPIALISANKWRTVVTAAATIVVLAAVSIAAFGTQPWVMFPQELAMQARVNLLAGPNTRWGYLQSVYGLVQYLDSGDALAWLAQGVTASGLAAIVWVVWRSRLRYALKASILSAAVLLATPYTLAYDMAAVAIPIAFLSTDQIRHGLLRGEQTIMLALFAASLPVLFTAGQAPVGAAIMLTLLCLILRRASCEWRAPAHAFETESP
jgi:arabinofuranan 3-O-arabinosyltransferase